MKPTVPRGRPTAAPAAGAADGVWLTDGLADELSAADLVALNDRADPVLARLWNNPRDAVYDTR